MIREIRPAAAYVLPGSGPDRVVAVPAKFCAWLERAAQLEHLQRAVAGADPEMDNVLEAVRWAGRNWRSFATGTSTVTRPELAPSSEWLSTTAVAVQLGISEPGVRKACREGRLEATNVAGRWRVSREALAHFRAGR